MGRARLSLIWFFIAVTLVARSPAQTPDGTATFRLYQLGQEVGRESATYTLVNGGRKIDATVSYTIQGKTLNLTGSIETTSDWSPRRLVVKGQTAPDASTDSEITVDGGRVHVRDGQRTADLDVSGKFFFPIDTFAPIVAQEQLLRYWRGHGRPAEILSAPGGAIHIEQRAEEQVDVGDRTVTLERVAIEGPVWGRQTAWIEGGGGLAALTTWAGGVPFAAFRQGYELRLDRFLDEATRDRLADLNRLAQDNIPDQLGEFALVGATVIDGTRRPPIQDATVIVRGDRIDSVGPSARVRLSADLPRVDVRGMTIVAGLWDMQARLMQVDWAPAYLAAGVTSVRDVAGEMTFVTAFRDAIVAGEGLGPRIVGAGLIEGPSPQGFGNVRPSTADDGRQAVRRYRSAGYRQIHLSREVDATIARAVILEAHRSGMTVIGAPPAGQSPEQALDAGVDELVMGPAGDAVDPAAVKSLLQAITRRRPALDPLVAYSELTVGTPPAASDSLRATIARLPVPLARSFGSALRSSADPNRQASLEFVRDALRAGARVVAGGYLGIPVFSLQRELELYVEGGMTPLEALQAATVVPAQVMKLDDSGTVENGKRADLVVLGADPLANISNLRNVKWVVAGGKLYEAARLWKLAGFAPPQ